MFTIVKEANIVLFLIFIVWLPGGLCCANDDDPADAADDPSRRRAIELSVWDRLNTAGAFKLSEEEEHALEETCLDQDYKLTLFQSNAHFFVAALVDQEDHDAPSECVSIGFASVLGKSTILKGKLDGLARFDFEFIGGKNTFKLREVLDAFWKATPVSNTGFLHQQDTCIHYSSRIWRELGVVETHDLAKFVIDSVIHDVPQELLDRVVASKAGGAMGLVAKFGMKKVVERTVYKELNIVESSHSEGVRGGGGGGRELSNEEEAFAGLGYGFGHRHFEGECKHAPFDVELLVMGNVFIFLEPGTKAKAAGCSAFLLYCSQHPASGDLVKEVIRFDDGIPPHDELSSQHEATILTIGQRPLKEIVHANNIASVYSEGHEGEVGDLIINNPGDFVANFLALINHTTSDAERLVIAAGLVLSDQNLAATLRASTNESTVRGMSDMELMEFVVKQRTEQMYT